MFFIGDVHAQWKSYLWMLHKMQVSDEDFAAAQDLPVNVARVSGVLDGDKVMDCSLQLGDFGFFREKDMERVPELANHKFFRGNHDNPELCYSHPNHIGDLGYFPGIELFWTCGGFSIDRAWRIEGSSWWADEEMSIARLMQGVTLFGDRKPKIAVSHECPSVVKEYVTIPGKEIVSRTEQALQAMWDVHKPDIWVFGHHHRRFIKSVGGTLFIGLGELISGLVINCHFHIPGLTWDNAGKVEQI
jgi:hypothetical protein